jgi:hypothetical protein
VRAFFTAFSLRRQSFACAAHAIGNEQLVDLLEFGGEQTIEGVFETDIARATPPTHVDEHAERTL